ncbi:MAG: uncharacterized protein JWN17_2187 [Frankiales bacterium]|nr:uncharacterized protein [Frankiales bacterium]
MTTAPDPAPEPARDRRAVGLQLGREPRAMTSVAHRCPCSLPDVVETAPRLPDGSPFPTLYYLTCPKLASRIGTLESEGLMREMTERLETDPDLRARYEAAAADYVARRDAHEVLEGVPAQGGMPVRVKCLHVLVAHSLAAGPGVNPFGDEALEALPDWWASGPCVDPDDPDAVPGKKLHR